jgi:hypothetical protein
LHGIPEEDTINLTLSLACSSKNDTTIYTSSTSNMPMGMNITKHHESVLSMPPDTPPPSLTTDSLSSDQMNYSAVTSESGTDVDGEQDMEIDETAEMEWEVFKKDIWDELAQDAAQLEELGEEKEWEENKENNKCTLKVEPDIYDRLHYAYKQSAGRPPTNKIMVQLQDLYLTIKKMYPESDSSNSANEKATTGLSPNTLIKKLPVSAIHTSVATNYVPIISSPLALNPPAIFQPPKPPLVFLVQEVKSVNNSEPVEVKSTSTGNSHKGRGLSNEKNVSPIAKADVNMGDIDLLETSKPAEDPKLVPTTPASPVDGELINKKEDPFFQTQKVD